MAGLTLQQAEEKLNGWLDADTKIMSGQTVKFNDRLITRADAVEVRNNIDYWQKKCIELENKEQGGRGARSRNVTANW